MNSRCRSTSRSTVTVPSHMMAQHILTRPVFEALFEGYDFTGGNPVAQALDTLRGDFGEFGLENETRDLERFYESVRLRARGLDNSEARQRVLMELYEKFFATAMKKDADRLGIVYTPVEIVDFILASARPGATRRIRATRSVTKACPRPRPFHRHGYLSRSADCNRR